jgi:tetratricopeptide (TPR) repeat protein
MPKLPCPDELWPAFSELLDEVLDLPLSRRAAWLAALGPEHAEVVPWLSKVMAADGNVTGAGFMNTLSAEPLEDSDFSPGQSVGPYLLERRLGDGGMGEVWLATRSDGTLTRRVALKLPHRYLFAGVLRRRFERERDILAALSHPNIAHLYDAGVDDQQHPFLAMEWVDGVSLGEHCANLKVPLQSRLDLFLQILDAVGYAHGRLIAHRDIKPSNILVTREHSIKLLDFGIAKLLTGAASDGATQLTQADTRLATPDYAAPEQLAGEAVTVAVDIYALGVVFYELLSGGRPFPRHFRRAGELPPPRASAHIRSGFAVSVGGMTERQLRRALSGDLDAIAAKALETRAADRYQSAAEFAADIHNSLAHRPIAARRVGVPLLTAKFLRRHWLGAAMSFSLLLALIGGSAGIAWQALRVEREAQRATTIKNFLIDVFRASDPRIAEGKPRGEITARELLDISADRIDSSFALEPETQIELLGVTADIYRELDETRRSSKLYARESELARGHYGANDPHTIDGLLGEAWNANIDADYTRALALVAQVDPLIRAARLDTSASRARWYMVRGEALSSDAERHTEARHDLEQAAELFSQTAPNDPLYPDVLIDLGATALEESQFAISAGYYRRAISAALSNRESGGDLLLANAGLALALKDQGDFAGAASAFAKGTATAERSYGRASRSYWAIASDWAKFRYDRGEREPALNAFAVLIDTLPKSREAFRSASDAIEGAQVLRKYGRILATDGQGATAIAYLQRAQTMAKTSALHTIDAVRFEFDLAKAYEAGNLDAEARAAYLDVIRQFAGKGGGAAPLAIAQERFGRFLLRHEDFDGARLQFEESLRLSTGRVTEAALLAQAGLSAVAAARADPRIAGEASLRAMAQLEQLDGFYDIRIQPYVWQVRARALKLGGDLPAARALAQRALEAERRYYGPESVDRRSTEVLVQEIDRLAQPHP